MIRKHSDNDERVGRYIICCRYVAQMSSENVMMLCKSEQLITCVMSNDGQSVIRV
jgi:hypothetical protein